MLGRLKMVLLGAPDDVRCGVLSLPIAIESLLPLIGIRPGGGGFAELASATIDGVLPIDADGRTGTGTTELSRRARFAVGMSALGGGGGLGSGEGSRFSSASVVAAASSRPAIGGIHGGWAPVAAAAAAATAAAAAAAGEVACAPTSVP